MLKRPRLAARKEPQQPRARQTWDDVLDAAARCLELEGIDVSMTRISEVSGYSIGTVYQYFPDRAALLSALQLRVTETTLARIAEATPEIMTLPLREGVARLLGVIARDATEHRVLTAAVYRDVVPAASGDDWEDMLPEYSALLSGYLGSRAHEMRACDVDRAAFFVLQSAEAIVQQASVHHPAWMDDPAFTDELVRLVLGYLAPASGS